jgi:uncharacterized protein
MMATHEQPKEKRFTLGDWKADLRPFKTFRVAVSGDVVLNRLETDIVDTPDFQRLRTLKQLGLCYLVYPSAQHTRFEHLLGCVKKAEAILQMAATNPRSGPQQDWITPQAIQITRLAALLHDVGNVPMGHTLEDETRVLSENQEDLQRYDRVLGPDTDIGGILISFLKKEGHAALLRVLATKEKDTPALGDFAFICDAVKNTVCADLLDYLERDAYFCNLNIGVGDRFLRYLFLAPKNGARRLAVSLWKERDDRPRDDVVSELIQLLQARYYLAERVYFHHTKLITSAMIGRAVWSAMHPEKGTRLTELEMSKLGDSQLIDRIQSLGDPLAKKLGGMLANRVLYKRAYALPRSAAEADKKEGRLNRIKTQYYLDPANRYKVEDEVANLCGLDPGDILLYCPDPDMNFKAAKMLVTWADGVIPLQEVEDSLIHNKIENIVNSHRNLWSANAYVHPQKITDRVMTLLTDLCEEHIEGDGQYRPDLVERLLFDVAAEEGLQVGPREIRDRAEKLVAEARGKPSSLARSYLRDQLTGIAPQQPSD